MVASRAAPAVLVHAARRVPPVCTASPKALHVATGLASIPLLLAKLWVVYPKLFAWPPFKSIATLLERLALLPLIGGGLFLVFTGLANINLWYPWPFSFPTAHYWVAWITIGALVVHIGAKLATTRHALRRPRRHRRRRRIPPTIRAAGGRSSEPSS